MDIANSALMPIIHTALEEGQKVRLIVNGSSMLPFIVGNDTIEIEPIPSQLMRGHIVLAEPVKGRYVIHRIVRIRENQIFLRGDAQNRTEGPLTLQSVYGCIVSTSRNGRVYQLNSGWLHMAGMIWIGCAPLTGWLLRLIVDLGRRDKRA